MENLKFLRESSGLSLGHLAGLLGIDAKTYEQYEAGVREIPLDNLIRLAYCFDTSLDYLADVTDEPRPHPRKRKSYSEQLCLTIE